MKGVPVYQQVQAFLAKGFSYRQIARELEIDRRTVKKYANLPLSDAADYFERGVVRASGFDVAKDFIISKLLAYPKIRTSNLYHQVIERYSEITLGERAFRNYVNKIKASLELSSTSKRYFEPVTEWQAGKYMQVDPGEQSIVLQNGSRMRIHFVSFVLCHSRYMYVHYSTRPYNTDMFIAAHLAAFRYFGGIPHHGIYDQTKLVAISESYREVVYNSLFQRFFLSRNFQAIVCEGYDPQSKGMVEKSIDYIKSSFLYGREFAGIEDLRNQSAHWLSTVANVRTHNTTLQQPAYLHSEEQSSLLPLSAHDYPPACRKVDKTGLFSFQGRYYSVPYHLQSQEVEIRTIDNTLEVVDPRTSEIVAIWDTITNNSRINKNKNHYIDYSQQLKDEFELSIRVLEEMGIPDAEKLLLRLKEDNPKHPRCQIRGIRSIFKKYPLRLVLSSMDEIRSFPTISCHRIKNLLSVKQQTVLQKKSKQTVPQNIDKLISENRFRNLDYYNQVISGGFND